MPEFQIWQIFAGFGIPGLALGVFYMLFRSFRFELPRVPRNWVGPIAALFIIVIGSVSSLGLALWAPPNGNNVQSELRQRIELLNRQLRPIYFSLSYPWDSLGTIDVRETGGNGAEPEAATAQDPFGRSLELDDRGREKLRRYAELIRSLPDGQYTLLIEGHTSRTVEYANMMLAGTRIEHVKDYLVQCGISPDSMSTVAFGGEEWDGNEDDYSERVELKLFASDLE